jgi:hypothetical protein
MTQLAVAKAAFSATLATPGEPKLPAQLVAKLQSLLSAVTAKPSQRNVKVQTCYGNAYSTGMPFMDTRALLFAQESDGKFSDYSCVVSNNRLSCASSPRIQPPSRHS